MTLLTVVRVAATAPVSADATAFIVVVPTIFSNPFLRILTVIELVVFVEGGALILYTFTVYTLALLYIFDIVLD